MTTIKNDLRVLFWDIEATNLDADFGFLLCIGYKFKGEKAHCIRIDDSPTFAKDHTDDRWVLNEFRKVLEQADLIVHHYGDRFDYPFIQSRCLFHGMKVMPRLPSIDTWRVARNGLKLSSNRLAAITNLLNVGEKTPLVGRIWVKAMSGDTKAISYIVKHCLQDVKVLEMVYDRIMPVRPSGSGPVMSSVGCPSCGSHHIHRRGLVRTVKTLKQRWSCLDCGHWFTRRG
jgi:uncharacterized protein YprB with RNaseH-like and TPR domain/predicted RNA-binding Zn-ribbon protein involved in translation (DUF1610 family)